MLVEIDGYYSQSIVYGRDCNDVELKRMYRNALAEVRDIKELAEVFCKMHNFVIVPYSKDIQVDFVIDTDTNRI
ncbi:hypothetical protein DCC85_06490 [Paenibacillus sp. CAA11]|uniref:hypothetical protein n=1 Tax=Paenibacillus sp. CAA11 TaxID=1532905 RepID=UPI000D3B1F1C|nr:hypothetical protein [Paenibacillus sp. CAA11]AWB43903.1 hypothetical protein DCC85_06490 [Paenibacillus sp. CAA11]